MKRTQRNVSSGLPGPVTSHCDILTNWIRMFKVSVVSGAACTGAQVHTATCWVTEQLQPLLTGCILDAEPEQTLQHSDD